ncbi:putative DNA-invertase from lambdoid prophage Rac [Vibrio crassostreae]|uniref:recombinase family protein n=1 Tax=Vibrio crassostreae TaxID=246167 RepID=UPI0005E0A704|nr:recombinase family protein [Vibrio crassostreae]TCT67641.1 DNA invertase Pin-like site-specific DNA recombinase [Vibrio crassostreae]TCT86928.1 DNA invertase Pin-like site-specific DNA recombinase [Vibrio crassostreae]TCU07887.1 DNA invertase Pin-like site-specific DNA recombinase [Vibrio crassostreae]TDW13293.1 DNA invertase Pin-like site-specific DNA recombinase [Vibrio crassostreae]CAK1702795.1 putative DNA-invertase from lambdoid prophage Rac [Vibrio crassostreae]
MQFIYSRVSTVEQNVQQQTEYLKSHYAHGAVFEDKFSGKSMEREQFQKMLGKLRHGDTVVFYDISRIGRNTQDVLTFCDQMKEDGVKVVIHTLGGIDITSATGKMVLTTLAGIAEMQRTEMLEKQAIGIARAKAEGKFKGKQVSDESKEEFKKVMELIDLGMSANKAIETVGMNKSKFYRLKKATTET